MTGHQKERDFRQMARQTLCRARETLPTPPSGKLVPPHLAHYVQQLAVPVRGMCTNWCVQKVRQNTIKPGEESLVFDASRYEECGLGARTEAHNNYRGLNPRLVLENTKKYFKSNS